MTKKTVGFIPLRKNSKGIPSKNKKKLLGRPLFTWVLTEAIFSKLDEIYIFTDDDEILDYVEKHFNWTARVSCLKRSSENAEDTSSTEDAILEFCDKISYDFDVFCLLQATSPLTNRADIDKALTKLQEENLDAILSVVKTHRFIWSKEGKSLNYDIHNRPRRQDFEGLLVENGAIYCTTKEALQASKNRISGSIGTIEMDEDSFVEIDSSSDWLVVEQLLAATFKKQKSCSKINHLVLDMDGVFTDGTVTFTKDGEFSKAFDMRDGMGLEILRQSHVKVIIMTSENSEVVKQRMKKLQIEDVFLGIKDKYSCLENICKERNIALHEVAYIGDDINDLSNMVRVGWSFCPSNGKKDILYHADIILKNSSGHGAIREAAEFIINYNTRF
ncbi:MULTISPECIES: acylneuraminate cytidylyltransferase [Flavobacteriaceae]|uniref:acylneuraminate cytidylyltransferase n=1 Tax=Flavobacteriaceae TaxID=49546 RepID=UPI0014918A8D|nr:MULTISPECIES: acylneuraminate cytidylyltransferase [Allomuricauda]MDC6367446.1 acylneuraminate cytidylyltransferase [Muricauda sp. AC10]